jgi:hypothetical protein
VWNAQVSNPVSETHRDRTILIEFTGAAMTHPGPDHTAPGQPGTPEGAWAPQNDPQAQPEKKSSTKKWASLAGTVVVVGVGGAYALTGGFGIGDPKVNDCVHMKSESDFEVVDCDSGDADLKIVGTEDEKKTEADFMADPASCSAFETAEAALWASGSMITEKGTVYCAASL